MKKVNESQFIWAEKYRPQTIDDVILPQEVRNKFKEFVKKERFPHLLLTSVGAGLGKTSVTNAIIKDLNADVLWINGSQDRGIDSMKNKVVDFIISVSIDDSPKIVVVDEADGLTTDAQKILRGIIEEHSQNSTFIMTANYKDKLIEPLRNRFSYFDFDALYNQNKKEIGMQVFQRLQFILTNENIHFEPKDLQPVVSNLFPSVRKMVITLQQSVQDGNLILDSKMINLSTKFTDIMDFIKQKKFVEVRKELQELDDPGSLYTYVFKNLDEWFTPQSQPQVILLCAKYQDMHERARDKSITASAFTVEIMGTPSIEFV